jgi:tetraacyldisaccharide-1-P 4'-kinase
MNKRKEYPDHRKYQSWQLKRLLRQIECNLNDLTTYILTTDQHQQRIKETKEPFDEISLRLD